MPAQSLLSMETGAQKVPSTRDYPAAPIATKHHICPCDGAAVLKQGLQLLPGVLPGQTLHHDLQAHTTDLYSVLGATCGQT